MIAMMTRLYMAGMADMADMADMTITIIILPTSLIEISVSKLYLAVVLVEYHRFRRCSVF